MHGSWTDSKIRNRETARADFIFYSNRIIRLLVEAGLNYLPVVDDAVITPIGDTYHGIKFKGKICGVSIMRAGEAMEQGLRDCCRSVKIGKILIQRDEETSKARLFYEKLPADIAERWVLLMDPMLATGRWLPCSIPRLIPGGSASMAIDVLKSRGVSEARILFLSIIASPEGVARFSAQYPLIQCVTAAMDEGLNNKKYGLISKNYADVRYRLIQPGLGDFGDRFYTL